MNWNIYNTTYINSDEIISDFEFFVSNNQFFLELKNIDFSINLHGRTVLPCFINSFDNLLATYRPFYGKKKNYYNWLEWDNELKSSELFKERLLLDREDLYFLGSYKNIFSGVDFVVDHIPKFVFEDLIDFLDIELLKDFGIAHSPVSYSLNWGKGIKIEYEYAIKNQLPFLIRVGEGFDKESKNSIKKLNELGVLSKNTILINGINLDDEDIELIKKSESKFVWCPEINEIMFGTTAPIDKLIQKDILVCLGTGSSIQGSKNLLSTIKVASKYIKNSQLILKMITENPIKAFFLEKKGKIKNYFSADFIVLDIVSPKNFDFLFTLEQDQILLVIHKGLPVYSGEEFKELFNILNIDFEKIVVSKKERFVKKGFTRKLNEIFQKLGKKIEFPFL